MAYLLPEAAFISMLFYKTKNHEAYISHDKVQITASRKIIFLVLVYDIIEHPMMLAQTKK